MIFPHKSPTRLTRGDQIMVADSFQACCVVTVYFCCLLDTGIYPT